MDQIAAHLECFEVWIRVLVESDGGWSKIKKIKTSNQLFSFLHCVESSIIQSLQEVLPQSYLGKVKRRSSFDQQTRLDQGQFSR